MTPKLPVRRQFTLFSGTAMNRTRLVLGQWLRAIWLIVAVWKGMSARTLYEMLCITYEVARHLCDCIRAMMTDKRVVLSEPAATSPWRRGSRARAAHRATTSSSGSGARSSTAVPTTPNGPKRRRPRSTEAAPTGRRPDTVQAPARIASTTTFPERGTTTRKCRAWITS